jgi:hypothetical protein
MKGKLILTAAAVAIGALSFAVGCNKDSEEAKQANARQADVAPSTRPNDSQQASAAGSTAQHAADWMNGNSTSQPSELATAPDTKSIKSFLADVAEDGMKKNAFGKLSDRFVQADSKRIGDYKADTTQLDGIVDSLQKQWNSHYGHDFTAKNYESTYSPAYARIWEGEETGKYGEAITAGSTATTQPSVAAGVDKPGSVAAEQNRNDKGRNVAKVTIAANHGMPELVVPLIHEFPMSWKIDVPDSVDGPRFLSNLERELTAFKNSEAQWPADEGEATRMFTHRVLMAVLDAKPAMGQ